MNVRAKLNELLQEERRLAEEARKAQERWEAAKARLAAVEEAIDGSKATPPPASPGVAPDSTEPVKAASPSGYGDTARVRALIASRAHWSKPVRTVTTAYVARKLKLDPADVQKILSYITRAGGLERIGVGRYALVNEELLLSGRPPNMK